MPALVDIEVEYSHTEGVVFVNVWQEDWLVQQYVLPKNVPLDALQKRIEKILADFSEPAEAI